MTEKRFTYSGVTATEIEVYENEEYFGETCHSGICNTFVDKAVNKLNQQYNTIQDLKKENEQLKSEINMLKVTIGRNEAHIKRLTEKSNWRTSAYD